MVFKDEIRRAGRHALARTLKHLNGDLSVDSTQEKGLRRKMLAISTCTLFGLGMLAAAPTFAASTQHLYRQSLNNATTNGLSTQFSLGSNASLHATFSAPTKRGTTTSRMQQMYRGVPVYGRSVAVERDASGHSLLATGVISQGLSADLASVTPKLSANQALDILQGKSRRGGRILSGFADQRTTDIRNREAKLYVYPEDSGSARLVYLTSFVKDGRNPSRPTAIIDASTGAVIEQWDGLTTANGTGPGGNSKVGQYQYGSGGHPYLNITQSGSSCSMQNANVKTYDMNNASSGSGTLWTFTCSNSSGDSVNGGYSPINDAHHNGGVVHDMYQAWFGSPPLNQVLYMRVHYGSNYENAFWDGTAMNFGDGASNFYPLTALDVTGHEISHGFTEQHSNLQYSGQSGGMNEAFSDMAGEAVEYYDRGTNDFLVGDDITKGSSPLRWMCTPTNDGGSIDSANNYNSGLDVHYSSGVYNKAFCVLAKTSGWTTKKAFEVFERANALYWTSTATFNSGACGVESAAGDLGYSSSDVVSAFNAVDVSCPGSGGGGGGGGSGGGALSNGVAVSVPATSSGNLTGDYTVDIPAGASNLQIAISGGSGDADLYVKFGSAPTTSSYDCRPYKSGNSETCSFATPSTGTYHVKINAYQSFSGVSLQASWTTGGGGGGGGGGGTVLDNGVPVSLPSTSTGNFTSDYTVDIPAGASNLQIAISGGSGDADLYVKFGSAPTTTSYDCRPYKSGNSESCSFATPSAGTYHVKVRAYSSISGVSLQASWTTGGGGGGGGGGSGDLSNGVPLSLPATSTGSFTSDYTVVIPSGTSNLTVAISGGSGDADLYVRFGSAPTTSTYDCRPYKNGNNETCTFSAPQAGTYHVKVRAYQSFSGVSLQANW